MELSTLKISSDGRNLNVSVTSKHCAVRLQKSFLKFVGLYVNRNRWPIRIRNKNQHGRETFKACAMVKNLSISLLVQSVDSEV